MAEVKGRTCDRPDCDTFLTNSPTAPVGWARVRIVTGEKVRDDDPDREFCSNRCAAIWFIDRHEAETGKRIVRQSKRGAT